MPPRPDGAPLAWDDADLDTLATPTTADAKSAASAWERWAPAWAALLLGFIGLLGAVQRQQAPRFTWEPGPLRYRAPNGRLVPEAAVRQAVDGVIDASAERLAALGGQLRAGGLDLPTWQQTMATELRTLHLAMASAAQGGWAQMAPADYQRAAEAIRVQLAYLERFAADLATGRQPLDGRVEARARLYAQAARGTYEQTRRAQQAQRPQMQERRVRHASESCAGCVDLAGQGWQPIGTLPRIGDGAPCMSNCRCSFAFRMAPAEAA